MDEKNSPVGLLHFYNLNIRLIESLYLFHSGTSNNLPIQSLSEPAPLETCLWRDYPTNLTDAELSNPLKISKSFFEAYSVQHTGNNYMSGWDMVCHQKRPVNSLQHPT
jgi:hypothetical protein